MGLISSMKRPDQEPQAAAAPRREAREGVDSLIGAGMVLDGDCETSGTLRVDGHVTGNVRARRLTVGTSGRVDGDVAGPDGGAAEGGVLIDGRVDGTITAPHVEVGQRGSVGGGMRVREAVVRGRVAGAVVTEHRLLLEATAVVEGDVTAKRLGLAEGGQVFGTIRIGDRASAGRRAEPPVEPERPAAPRKEDEEARAPAE